jgi:hypothetical protein
MKIDWQKDIFDYLIMRLAGGLLGIVLLEIGSFIIYGELRKGVKIPALSIVPILSISLGIMLLYLVIKKQIQQQNIKDK